MQQTSAMQPLYFWGEEGVIRHTSKSLLSAIAFAINCNVGITQDDSAPDDDMNDTQEDKDILRLLLDRIKQAGHDVQLKVSEDDITFEDLEKTPEPLASSGN